MSKYEYFKDEAFKFEMESMCEEQNVKYIDPLDIKDIRIENAKSLGDLKHFSESLRVLAFHGRFLKTLKCSRSCLN